MFSIFILFIIGFILITKGADIFINCTVDIGRRTNISELLLGATVVSFATTLPEFTVSMISAMNGYTTMSLGNAVGSIICNTGLILGLVSIISPFKVDKKMFSSKTIMLLVSIGMLFVLCMDNKISSYNGLMLLIMLGIYMSTNYRSVKKENKTSCNDKPIKTTLKDWIYLIGLFTLGIVMMVVGSRLLVDNGVEIAELIGIPQGIISLSVIALGTSLPELVSSLTAIKKNHHAICVGNILGANTLNILSVIGGASLIKDIPILGQTMTIDFPVMVALLLVLIIPTLKTHKLQRLQGMGLLGIYIIYIITLYFIYM